MEQNKTEHVKFIKDKLEAQLFIETLKKENFEVIEIFLPDQLQYKIMWGEKFSGNL